MAKRKAVVNHASALSQHASITLDASASYGIIDAQIKSHFHHNNDVSDMLEDSLVDEEEQTKSYHNIEDRVYNVGPHSRVVLYQQVFICSGIHFKMNVFKTTQEPLPYNQLFEEVPIDVVIAPRIFIKGVKVVYGDDISDRPVERVHSWRGAPFKQGRTDDVNAGYGGKYVFLVPEITTNVNEALTRFEIIITDKTLKSENSLSKGSSGKNRYLRPVRDKNNNMYITDLMLAWYKRTPNGNYTIDRDIWPNLPKGYDTTSINDGRKGPDEFLVWKLEEVYMI
ncbi:hypothetical protein C0995_010336 [Termitomyces sp. Mi166|nr:hypothetical protein C0995_010336 [Termitomyces sp. Mi166\